MPWIWNDKDFIKNETKVIKTDMKIGIPIFIFISLFWYFIIFNIINLKEYVFLVFISVFWILTIVKILCKLPNSYISKNTSLIERKGIYFTQLTIVSFLFYMCVVGILQHYYPFFENLVCCDLVRNFNLDF